ncbi:MAG: hydrogenase maturation nickel metallochaperone HypA [Thermoplasmata archaeon]|nr:hydrogenase maturation nickel metallochaperone HypA [Thermoplasmata archaeon]
MHEQHALRDLRRRLEEVAPPDGGGRVVRVRLWIGALSHITEASIRSAWPAAFEGSVARDAQLVVERSRDERDPRAQGLVLSGVDVDLPEPSPPAAGPTARPGEMAI